MEYANFHSTPRIQAQPYHHEHSPNTTPDNEVQAAPEPYVDATAAAEFLSISKRRVLDLARADEIPAYPLGDGERRVWRFRLSTLARWMEARVNCARSSRPCSPQETA